MKRHIVCLGDSNTHGYCADPADCADGSLRRFNESERWTCRLQAALGEDFLVLEEGLPGRTTVFDDPVEESLSALPYLYPCLMSHAPVSLLVVTCSGVLLSAFRGGYLQRRFWPVMLCAWAGVLLHQGLMFSLGLFLGSTAAGRWMEALGGGLGTCLACCALYPLVLALGKIGGETWKE